VTDRSGPQSAAETRRVLARAWREPCGRVWGRRLGDVSGSPGHSKARMNRALALPMVGVGSAIRCGSLATFHRRACRLALGFRDHRAGTPVGWWVPRRTLSNWDFFAGARRESELGQVVDLLGNSRIVTLTGVGRSGKTRLHSFSQAMPSLSRFSPRLCLTQSGTGTLLRLERQYGLAAHLER
jgi:hypothetical protein